MKVDPRIACRFRMRRRMPIAAALAAVLVAGPAGGSAREPHRVVDRACGVAVTFPSEAWTLVRESVAPGPVVTRVYAPKDPPVPGLTIQKAAAEVFPGGLALRAAQLEATQGVAIRPSAALIAGSTAERIEYEVHGVRAIEYGVSRGATFYLLFFSCLDSEWQDAEKRREFEAIFAAIEFLERPDEAREKPKPESTPAVTPDQVRAARRFAEGPPSTFAIRSHDVAVEIWPAEKRLRCTDRFEVEILAEDVSAIGLVLTHVEIEHFFSGDRHLSWRTVAEGHVRVELPRAMRRGERITIHYAARSDDYFVSLQQGLIAEVEVLGQVRETSSFSSHVYYYPTDALNDAAVRIAFTVPEGYVAVSGGQPARRKSGDGPTTFRYEMPVRRPRLLPLGFAVARYETQRARTAGGLSLEFHHWPGDAERARQYLDVAVRAGNLFEKRMGLPPWNRVAFCHVKPERRETGVSLPGLILLSDAFFRDLEGARLRGAKLGDRESVGVLVIADELSHQWNVYLAQLPNELGEGVSTFTNLLFLEAEEGAEEYRAGVAYCVESYLSTVEALSQDRALADPMLYASRAYRAVAFTKVPAVLHDLRRRLGDTAFFAGWRRVFETVRDRATAYEDFRTAFEAVSKQDLRAYFDGWFFRPGYPEVSVQWEPVEVSDKPALRVVLRQTHEGDPFEIELDVEVAGADGARTIHAVSLRRAEETFTWERPAMPATIRLSPGGTSLVKQVSEAR